LIIDIPHYVFYVKKGTYGRFSAGHSELRKHKPDMLQSRSTKTVCCPRTDPPNGPSL